MTTVKKDTTINHEEMQYIQLVKDILDKGFLEEGRNGKTISILELLCVFH